MSNSSYICLTCRVADKTGGTCLRCGNHMLRMGPKFEAPKRRQVKQWQRLGLLLAAAGSGLNLCSDWCCVNYRSPSILSRGKPSLSETKHWIKRRQTHRQNEVPQAPRRYR